MAATFESIGSLRIDDSRFAIYGNILSGKLSSGQTVVIPLNGSKSITLRIDSIEFLDRIRENISYVALTFHKLDGETVDLLKSHNLANAMLEISNP